MSVLLILTILSVMPFVLWLGWLLNQEMKDDDWEQISEPIKMAAIAEVDAVTAADKKWGQPARKRGIKCPNCQYLGYGNWWPHNGNDSPYLMECTECEHTWVDSDTE